LEEEKHGFPVAADLIQLMPVPRSDVQSIFMVVQHYTVFAQLLDQQFDVDRVRVGCGDSGDTGDNLRDVTVGIWRQLGDGSGDTLQDRGRLIF